MATYVFTDPEGLFAVGASVSAYAAENWNAVGLPPRGAPLGSVAASGTVAANGQVTFTGLAHGARYYAAAVVDGAYRYVGFTVPVDVAAFRSAATLLGDGDIAPGAGIAQSKIAGLPASLAAAQTGKIIGVAASGRHFAKLYKALMKAKAGTGLVRVNFYGDSLTQGFQTSNPHFTNSFAARVRAYLATLYPVAGTGLVNMYFAVVSDADTRVVRTGTWTEFGGGVMGRALIFANGTDKKIDFTPDIAVDSFDVYYLKGSGGGTFNIAVDGGAPIAVNSNAASAYAKATIAAGSLGTHTLTITAPATNNAYIASVEGTVGSTGVIVNRLAAGGIASAGYGGASATAAGSGYNALQFDLVPPDVSFLAMGVNDFLGQVALATYKTQTQAAITKAAATGDVVLVVPPKPTPLSGSYPIPWTEYVKVMYDLAGINDLPVLDMTVRWTDHTVSPTFYHVDHIHMTDAGAVDWATAIDQLLVAYAT